MASAHSTKAGLRTAFFARGLAESGPRKRPPAAVDAPAIRSENRHNPMELADIAYVLDCSRYI
jgi:hypothetical protein